jgi:hypothetical protein
MKLMYVIGSSTGIALATRSRANRGRSTPDLPATCHSVRRVARTSLGDAIQQHLLRYFFQLRITCNKAWEWMESPFDLAFGRENRKSDRSG